MQDGTPVLVTRRGTTFKDPSQRYSIEELIEEFPCMSTLVKLQDGTWDCGGHSHSEVDAHRRMVNFDSRVQVPTTVVTLIHREGEQQVHQGEEVQQGQQEQEAPDRIQDLPEQPLQHPGRNVEQPDTPQQGPDLFQEDLMNDVVMPGPHQQGDDARMIPPDPRRGEQEPV